MNFNLDDQISTHPEAFQASLEQTIAPVLRADRPIIFTGIGTSLHAARVAADWVLHLTGGKVPAFAIDAHDFALLTPLSGKEQVVVISHRGYKRYPNMALEKAKAVGVSTISVVGTDAPEQNADHTLRTCKNETAGTFSVSYIATLAVLGRLVAQFDQSDDQKFLSDLKSMPKALSDTLAQSAPVSVAKRIVEREPILIVGFGSDKITADEAALKIKEGAWMWTEGMSVEFSLHGTPAVYRAGQAAILMTPGSDDGGRMASLNSALGQLHMEVITCGCDTEDLCFAPVPALFRPIVSIVPFHRLTAELARLRGTDPDTLHGHREPWKSAMAAVTL